MELHNECVVHLESERIEAKGQKAKVKSSGQKAKVATF